MKNSYIYFIAETRNQGASSGPVKIGLAKKPKSRLKALQTGSSRPLELLLTIGPMSRRHAEDMERLMHRKFRRWFLRGEWFKKGCLDQIGRIKTAPYEGSIRLYHTDFYDDDNLRIPIRPKARAYV